MQRQIDHARVDELAESMAQHGVIEPIVVRQVGDAYHLIDGEHRLEAAAKAGLSAVPGVVRAVDDTDAEMMSIHANLHAEPSTPEWADALSRYEELWELKHGKVNHRGGRPKKTAQPPRSFVAEAAEAFGTSKRTIQQSLARTKNLTSEVKEAWKDGEICDSQADELAKLPAAQQEELLDEVKDQTRAETRALVRKARPQGRQGEQDSAALMHKTIVLASRLKENLADVIKALKKGVGLHGVGDKLNAELRTIGNLRERLLAAVERSGRASKRATKAKRPTTKRAKRAAGKAR